MGTTPQKGYRVYMDNYYNSVSLYESLLREGVYACGTLCLVRGSPYALRQVGERAMSLSRDELHFRRNGDTFFICWKDTRLVSIVTNIHDFDTHQHSRSQKGTRGRITLNRPVAIRDYNRYVCGVDRFDQMIKYAFVRRTNKWTKKILYYLI